MPTTKSKPSVLSASTITGDSVANRRGEDLGTIKDLMIEVKSGRIAYAVLSFGGFMGFGDKLFAIPFSALKLRADKHKFELDVDTKKLERSQGFDKDNWPDMADRKWQSALHEVYSVRPYWQD